ncbi:MAG: DUF3863 domain-containing protein [Capsulimonas sp.]|uniref:DUF3863 domain-containing protein n=1 Tax=Capsulimonas sp. TaxID=2494211 RepID=UPI003264F75B
MTLTRRDLLKLGAFTLAGANLLTSPAFAKTPGKSSLMGGRFFTYVGFVRVNQIEARRDKNVGEDEAEFNTPDQMQLQRDTFGEAFPGGRMTWAVSWEALTDKREQYVQVRKMLAGFHQDFGDEITFLPGGYFAPMYNTREEINQALHEGLALIGEIVGGGYRPKSVVAGYMAAANLEYLAKHEGIHVCQGNIWSQHGIDNGDGDGAVSYPYYPSTEHFLKPAQGKSDFIDCVNLDGWTCDFLSARSNGFSHGNSRLGLGPIETIYNHGLELGIQEQMHTTALHYDDGFSRNGFAWLTAIWEVSLVRLPGIIPSLTQYGQTVRQRWPGVKAVTVGEFGEAWRAQYPDNKKWDYQFDELGSGIEGSDIDTEIYWFMNREFRLALTRNREPNSRWQVIDFTRYDLPASEPQDAGPSKTVREWSLMNEINQKRTRGAQDDPRPLTELSESNQALIHKHYPKLFRPIPPPK